jgi:signal transduction histidine kinase
MNLAAPTLVIGVTRTLCRQEAQLGICTGLAPKLPYSRVSWRPRLTCAMLPHHQLAIALPAGGSMGSRGRSIRLRIYFLVAIPLITLIGLFAYVTTTTVHNAINLDRAPALISATSLPAANFVNFLQEERTAAVVYLSDPSTANLQQYQRAIAATDAGKPAFVAAMNSQATKDAETGSEAAAIGKIISGLSQLQTLRQGVEARALTPMQGFQLYTQGIGTEHVLFAAESESLTDATPAIQGLGLDELVQGREDLEQEDALLSGMLAAGRADRATLTASRIAFTQLAGNRQASLAAASSLLSPVEFAAYNGSVNHDAPAALQNGLITIEDAVAASTAGSRLPLTGAQWRQLASALESAYFAGGVAAAEAALTADHQITHDAWVRVAQISIIGLLGLILTILVSSLVGRGIIRRLGGLRRSALALAEEQLPSVVHRLRRGESVDVAAEAPPIRAGGDEIGQVGQAFDTVRQTAIRSAVEESRLRQGIRDVFRNLARRNQSLLHRQLTVLDAMERRATDPEALDDLFRLDHLTTRMRRHAEGLIILSGAPPGRAWSNPVRLIDVMRGAVAEVEDYARVSVVTQSKAALSGSAVADVIHLLAELIENATTLSPPYTAVRVAGEMVGNGFAIEIEDRGLGMSAQRLAELNERLASPTEFNPVNSEQLGLFVVGQLARRHGISVTLRPSPYGGTTAIALIPSQLVVAEDAAAAGLPSAPPALTSGRAGGATGPSGPAPGPLRPVGPGGSGLPGVPFPDGQGAGAAGNSPYAGIRISGALRQSLSGPAENGPGRGAPGTPPPSGPVVPGIPVPPGVPVPPFMPPGAGRVVPGVTEPVDFDVFSPLHRDAGQEPGEQPRPSNGNGAPANGNRNDAAGAGPGVHGGAAPAGGGGTSAGTRPANSIGTARLPSFGGQGSQDAAAADDEDYKGLPRRVRQASLAPQLRRESPAGTAPGPSHQSGRQAAGGSPSGQELPTLAEIRSTMSAMQRGWQQGRSEIASNVAQPPSWDQEPAASREPGPGEPEDGRRFDGA